MKLLLRVLIYIALFFIILAIMWRVFLDMSLFTTMGF